MEESSGSPFNLTAHYKYQETLAVQSYGTILLVVGTLGNLMSILVLSRKTMRKSNAAIYLIVLAVLDLIVLYTGLLRLWVIAFFDFDFRHLSVAACKLQRWLLYASLQISVWILVALTFERLFSVYLPHRVKNYCTRMTSFVTIGVIIVVLLIVNSHFLYTVGKILNTNTGETVKLCASQPGTKKWFVYRIWPWIGMCLYSLIPLTIVSISNIAIVVKVYRGQLRSHSVHPLLHAAKEPQHQQARRGSRLKRLSSMTCMLVVLNVVLLVTTVPVSVFYITRPYVYSSDDDAFDVQEVTIQMKMEKAMYHLVMYTNHAVNFLLYCISGSRFRDELRNMFQTCSNRLSGARITEGRTSSSRRRGGKTKGMRARTPTITTAASIRTESPSTPRTPPKARFIVGSRLACCPRAVVTTFTHQGTTIQERTETEY